MYFRKAFEQLIYIQKHTEIKTLAFLKIKEYYILLYVNAKNKNV